MYPYIDWLGYLNSKMYADLKFHEDDPIILQTPSYFEKLGEVLNRTDKR